MIGDFEVEANKNDLSVSLQTRNLKSLAKEVNIVKYKYRDSFLIFDFYGF